MGDNENRTAIGNVFSVGQMVTGVCDMVAVGDVNTVRQVIANEALSCIRIGRDFGTSRTASRPFLLLQKDPLPFGALSALFHRISTLD